LACVVILGASFYAEENWRGVQAWTECKRGLEARGEILDWTNYIPAAVPDDRNFYKAPMMAEWFVRNYGTNFGGSLSPHLNNPDTDATVITDISASNYLAWSAAFETDFNQMRDALKRPEARLDGDYLNLVQEPLPDFVSYRNVTKLLAHRAKCYLLLGEPEKALADLTLLHDLNQTLVKHDQPTTLVASMIHVAITGLYADAVACGLEGRGWREPELAALQKQLAEINLPPAVVSSLRAERAKHVHMMETLSTDALQRTITGSSKSIQELGWWFMPSGWFYQNMAVFATLEQMPLDVYDVTNRTVSPGKAQVASQRTEEALRQVTPWNFIAAICIPNFSKALETTARNQTWADQAQIVCALERFRLANGKYPDTLAALAPQFIEKIPHDVIGGKPLHYSRKDDQNFQLYSIGWNETDDDGITAFDGGGKEDRERGDWVWRYPTQ
jgi:tetratricopeptide (TPR) repeat protein